MYIKQAPDDDGLFDEHYLELVLMDSISAILYLGVYYSFDLKGTEHRGDLHKPKINIIIIFR